MALFSAQAWAQPAHLRGLILATQPEHKRVIVRHDATGSMPAMTMTFSVVPKQAMQRLQAGQAIEAEVDRSTDPWTLRDVRVGLRMPLIGSVDAPAEQPHSAVRAGVPLVVGSLVPNTSFIDQTSAPFTFAKLRGNNVVLAFIYTRCQDPRMCPLISAKFHRLQELLRGSPTHLVEVSLDPGFDTSLVLTKYGRTFGADPKRWTLLTGNLDRALDFAAQFDVSALADPHYGIIHSERTVIIDPNGAIRQFIDETSWSPEEIVDALKAIDHQQSNPLLRLNLWLSAQAVAMCGNRLAGFSGFADLLIVVGIFAGCAWLLYRLARGIFAERA